MYKSQLFSYSTVFTSIDVGNNTDVSTSKQVDELFARWTDVPTNLDEFLTALFKHGKSKCEKEFDVFSREC